MVKDREENKKTWWQAIAAGKTATDYITEKDDGTVDFGTGNHKFTIKEDGLEFNGVRNNVSIWHNSDAKAFEPQTLNLDLSSFSTISIEFGSVMNGQLTSESACKPPSRWWAAPRVKRPGDFLTGTTAKAGFSPLTRTESSFSRANTRPPAMQTSQRAAEK